MILCVCLNPALDVTYRVPELRPGASHRTELVGSRPGGKGLNVARVLQQLGGQVLACGLAGGDTGEAVIRALQRAGVPARFTTIAGETRRAHTVVDDASGATVLNESGPRVTGEEWRRFVDAYSELSAAADSVVLSGSLPPGVPADAYRQLVEPVVADGKQVVLDAAGSALAAALPARPHVVKPNVAELTDLFGRELTSIDDVLAACRSLLDRGARAAVVSRGEQGLVYVTPERAVVVRGPRVVGNPTGAGDALAAALAWALHRGDSWDDALPFGVAVASAAVSIPTAGETDPGLAQALLPQVTVEELAWAW